MHDLAEKVWPVATPTLSSEIAVEKPGAFSGSDLQKDVLTAGFPVGSANHENLRHGLATQTLDSEYSLTHESESVLGGGFDAAACNELRGRAGAGAA
jgi:hypothetical protein